MKRGCPMFLSNFDGTPKGRKVRMGGRKQVEDRASLLARSRAQRNERAQERLRLSVASQLTRWARGRMVASKIKGDFRSTWDTQTQNLEQAILAFGMNGVPFPIPPQTLKVFIQQLCFFHPRVFTRVDQEDVDRVVRMCEFVKRGMSSQPQFSPYENHATICLMGRFCQVLLTDLQSPFSNVAIAEMLFLIVGKPHPNRIELLRFVFPEKSPEGLFTLWQTMPSADLSLLIQSIVVEACKLASIHTTSQQHMAICKNILGSFCDAYLADPTVTPQKNALCTQIQHLFAESPAQLTLFFLQISQEVLCLDGTGHRSKIRLVWATLWLCLPSLTSISQGTDIMLTDFAVSIANLLAHIEHNLCSGLVAYSLEVSLDSEDSAEEELELMGNEEEQSLSGISGIVWSQKNILRKLVQVPSDTDAPTDFIELLGLLSKRTILKLVFEPLLQLQQPDSRVLESVFNTYGWIVTLRPRDSGTLALVHTLVRTIPSFLKRLWSIISEQSRFKGDCLFVSTLLHRCASVHMMAANDRDLFDSTSSEFPRSFMETVATHLNEQLLDKMWVHPVLEEISGRGQLSPLESLRQLEHLRSAIQMFNDIYDRNNRRNFEHLSRDLFLWPDWVGIQASQLMAGSVVSKRGLVITCIPQVIPFFERVRMFQHLIDEDQVPGFHGVHITVRRETIYDDAMHALGGEPNMKGRIRVSYESGLGYTEAGIDGGGLYRDFMDRLCEKAFDPLNGLFKETTEHFLYPNPTSSTVQYNDLVHFEFMGKVLAKAIHSQILVKPQFSTFFLNKLLERQNSIDDLFTLDPELYRHLLSLKDIVKSGGNVADLTLSFTITTEKAGVMEVKELVPGGVHRAVDNNNFLEYIYRIADFKLNREIAPQCRAFLRGFHDLIPVNWIRMFDARELQMVISGDKHSIDIGNMKQFTVYGGGYHPSQPIIQWFWEIVQEFLPQQQADLLRFVTGCPRQPLLGFEHLEPRLAIQKVPLSDEGLRLPTASTCMNLLKLPDFPDKGTLRSKLLYSISAEAGFELS